MDTDRIRSFLTLAEVLNFTKAAESLRKSQSVLSRQISAMEEELGFPLFIRDSKICRLTRAGENMQKGLRKMDEEYELLIDDSRKLHQGQLGTLHIGMQSGELSDQYFILIDSFRARSSSVNLSIMAYDSLSINELLDSERLDLLFAVSSAPWFPSFNRPEYRHLDVGLRHDCLYVPSTHPLAGADPASLRLYDFRDETFCVLREYETAYCDRPTEKQCIAAGFRPHLKPMDSLASLVMNLENHQGVCIGSNHLLLSHNPNFKKLYLPELGQHTEIMLWSTENANPCLGLFVENARELLARDPGLAVRDPYYP